jgi:hypothetical protein
MRGRACCRRARIGPVKQVRAEYLGEAFAESPFLLSSRAALAVGITKIAVL